MSQIKISIKETKLIKQPYRLFVANEKFNSLTQKNQCWLTVSRIFRPTICLFKEGPFASDFSCLRGQRFLFMLKFRHYAIAGASGLFSLKAYDKYQTDEMLDSCIARCRVHAQEPLAVGDFGRSVAVMHDSHYFDLFCKPLFDAAAIDCETWTPARLPELFRLPPPQVIKRGWMGSYSEKPALTGLPLFDKPIYDPHVGIVCFSAKLFPEMAAQLQKLPLADFGQLHDIGYVPLLKLEGWSSIPTRMFNWFNQRHFAQKYTSATMDIVDSVVEPSAQEFWRTTDSETGEVTEGPWELCRFNVYRNQHRDCTS